MRKIIKEMVSSDPAFEVIGTARDGVDGVAKALALKPDLITMDIEMPKQDGLSALREIKARCHEFKPAVLMCSSLTVAGSHEALKAMRIGAADVIGKDPEVVGRKDDGFKQELLEKLRAIGEHRSHIHSTPPVDHTDSSAARSCPITNGVECSSEIDFSRVKAVAVGSSTGGPPVIEEIFSKLTDKLRVPIIVAQHMPKQFTVSLASRLNQFCKCNASLATHGSIISAPGIYIAQGGSHIKLTKIAGGKIIAKLTDSIPGAIYRPSVDYLFQTAAELYGEHLLAIQLTGMGADGANGAVAVKKAGGQIIAQSAASCVVYGMPKAVIELNLADRILAPKEIRDAITQLNGAPSLSNNPEISGSFESRRSA